MVYVLIFITFLFGIAIGSFLNVVAYRLVHGGSFIFGGSVCPKCKHKLAAADLIPIVSFLLLRGRCRYCRKKISLQYPIVEAATGVLFLAAAWKIFGVVTGSLNLNASISLLFLLFAISVLIVLFVADLLDGVLPNKITLPAIVLAAVYDIFLFASHQISLSALFYTFIAAAVAAVLFFAIVYFSGEKAMGGGDVKLAFFIGLAVGWPAVIVSFFLAFLTGGIASAMLLLTGKKRFGDTVPLGPFLSIGALIALLWGQTILSFYLNKFL
jgi:leader peptidase (prepilin peptidase)/N-methyltransferase